MALILRYAHARLILRYAYGRAMKEISHHHTGCISSVPKDGVHSFILYSVSQFVNVWWLGSPGYFSLLIVSVPNAEEQAEIA